MKDLYEELFEDEEYEDDFEEEDDDTWWYEEEFQVPLEDYDFEDWEDEEA